MKLRLLSTFAVVVLVFSLLTPMAYGAELDQEVPVSRVITRFPDGSYVVTEIYEGVSTFASGTKSAKKTAEAYTVSGTCVGSLTVYGDFTYNGSTASATGSSYSHSIKASGWSFSNGSSSCSGATATAKGTFKYLGQPKELSVSLTCSPTGTLS